MMPKLDLHYVEPILVDLYDIENPHGPDTDFYIQLAADLNAQTIVDLGCGTGLLTRQLAVDGRRVIGIDPAVAMLAYARRQPGSERVEWIEGTAVNIGQVNADLAVMTSNVAQLFLDDDEWAETLAYLRDGLKVGGRLAFESRNPLAKGWESWNPEESFYTLDTPHGPVESWVEVIRVIDGCVHFKGYNRFTQTGQELVVDSQLRFRTYDEIVSSLATAGFDVEHVYGSWQKRPFAKDVEKEDAAMIFFAQRL